MATELSEGESIQVGDVVWLMSDKAKNQAMVVEEVDHFLDEDDVLDMNLENPPPRQEKPLQARCVWRDEHSVPHEMIYSLPGLTKKQPKA